MERLFSRKRAVSNVDHTRRPQQLRKSPSSRELGEALNKRRVELDPVRPAVADMPASSKVADFAPRLDVDIRNSLMLPGLSEQFGLLIPALSTAAEETIRDILAAQRRRADGPALTEEEEEMFLAELRGSPAISSAPVPPVHRASRREPNGARPNHSGHPIQSLSLKQSLSHPTSSLTTPEAGPSSALSGTHFPYGVSSPPPTSTSFSSFRTFGVSNDDEKPLVKSYGFSGAGGMRDDSYLRKVQKGARERDLANVRKDQVDKESPRRQAPLPAAISTGKANASWTADRPVIGTGSSVGNDMAEQYATPTSFSALPTPGSLHDDEQITLTNTWRPHGEALPPESQDAEHPSPLSAKQNRQSFLHALTPSQVRRISMALADVDYRLHPHRPPLPQMSEDREEVLVPPSSQDEPLRTRSTRHTRHGSTSSVRSITSQSSGLPASPRTHDLAAHVSSEGVAPLVPRPVLTPVRTLPVRHTPSLSTDLGDHPNPVVPLYVPGQPRPVRSLHRSEGSVSTANEASSVQNSPMLSDISSLSARARSDLTPTQPVNPYIKARTSSLSKSTQSAHRATMSPPAESSKSFGDVNTPDKPRSREAAVPRGSSPFEMMVRTPSESILEEADEGKEDALSLDESRRSSMSSEMPQVRPTPNRRSVADSHRGPSDILGSNLSHGDLAPQMMANGNAWSHEGIIEYSSSGTVSRAKSPTSLRRRDSSGSSSSNFLDAANEDSPLHGVEFDGDGQHHFGVKNPKPDDLSRLLRKLSGLGQEELVLLQGKLVEKAKLERQALRRGDAASPGLAFTSVLHPISTYPAASPYTPRSMSPVTRPASPPSAWRSASPPPSGKTILAPVPDTANTISPIVLGDSSAGSELYEPSSGAASGLTGSASSSRSADASRDQGPSVPAPNQPRKSPAHLVDRSDVVPLHSDPAVVKDFEARLAKATAELVQAKTDIQRTPSAGKQSGLQRRGTKKGDKIAISNPKLVSSSYKPAASPITPPSRPVPVAGVPTEKFSGSNTTTTSRWRKLGFRRGPSLGGEQQAKSPHIGQANIPQLAGPINLRTPAQSGNSPDLDAFRFPPPASATLPKQPSAAPLMTPPSSADHGLRSMVDKLRHGRDRSRSDERQAVQLSDAQKSSLPANVQQSMPVVAQSDTAIHQRETSDESAIAKFIEAGKALGLKDDQLGEMLAQKGMLDRSTTSNSVRSVRSTAPSSVTGSQAPETPPMDALNRQPSLSRQTSTKGKSGLFRSFSRSKKKGMEDDAGLASGRTTPKPLPAPRSAVVRRTLLIADAPVGPTIMGAHGSSADPTASPGSRNPNIERKLSVKRKPLNLSAQDRELVSNDPATPVHRRLASLTSDHSDIEQSRADQLDSPVTATAVVPTSALLETPPKAEHGFRSSFSGSHVSVDAQSASMSRSSTGGSIFDLYGGEGGTQELLVSPATPRDAVDGRRMTQALEICEYEDGQVVWSLVDGLRTQDAPSDIDLPSDHSRQGSLSSKHDSMLQPSASNSSLRISSWRQPSPNAFPQLNLRHRDRNAVEARPETHIYQASAQDVAELIDHLSRDLNAEGRGRIDIRELDIFDSIPGAPASRAPLPASFSQGRSNGVRQAQPISPTEPNTSFSRPQFPLNALPRRDLLANSGHIRSGSGSVPSPSAPSFASSGSGAKTVEDRLQALMDRLRSEQPVG